MPIESVMSCNNLILWHTLLLKLSIFPSTRVFFNESVFKSGGQRFEVSASASVLPMNIQDWFPLGLIGLISLQCKGLSGVFSNTTIQEHQFFWCSVFSIVQLSQPYVTNWKNYRFDKMDLCQQSNVFAFWYAVQVGHSLSSKESFNFMAAVNICNDFGAQENKACHCFHCLPMY